MGQKIKCNWVWNLKIILDSKLGQILGSINMPIFGRIHEWRECKQWSGIKVWTMSGMKWTLSKNKEKRPSKFVLVTRVLSN